MKKSYVKPQVCFESFLLSASIAVDCGIRNPLLSENAQCAFDDNGKRVFLSVENGCRYEPDNNFKYCYDNPGGALKIFNSR